MSTYHYLILNAPLAVPEDEARAIVEEALRHVPTDPHDWNRSTCITDEFDFSVTDYDVGKPGIVFSDGRVRASLFLNNLERAVGSEFVDGVEVKDMRIRGLLLMNALTKVVDAKPGDILGAYRSEHGRVGAPVIMTERGVRVTYTNADPDGNHFSFGFSEPVEIVTLKRVPPSAITFDDDYDLWSCDIDETLLKAAVEAGRIDAHRKGVRRLETVVEGAILEHDAVVRIADHR